MRKVENPQEFRNNVVIKLKNLLKNEKLASNLEKGIFNYSLKHAEKINVVKKWDNSYFVKLYINRLRTITINLKNEELINSILNKKIKAHEVAFMTHQEMQPNKWEELLELKKIRDENKYEPKLEASTDDLSVGNVNQKNALIINYKPDLLMNR